MGNRPGFGMAIELRRRTQKRREIAARKSSVAQVQAQYPDDSARDHGTGHMSDMDMTFDSDRLRQEHS